MLAKNLSILYFLRVLSLERPYLSHTSDLSTCLSWLMYFR